MENVICTSYQTFITPSSEAIYGGMSPGYSGGYLSKLGLDVRPWKENVPVKKLNFNGFSPVKSGDVIIAKIPVYEEKKFSNWHFEKNFYLPREMGLEESAVEIVILSSDGLLRTDRSVEYSNIFGK